MNNTYNAKMFAQLNYDTPETWTTNQTAFIQGMCAQYGLNQTEMLLTWDTFTEMSHYISGGSQAVIKNSDLIVGWKSDMAERISPYTEYPFILSGDAIYYSPYVTPAITNYIGPLSEQTFTTYTGVGEGQDANIAGRIVAQNGVGFPNQIFKVWDGEKLVTTQNPVAGAESTFDSQLVFDGMQNAPVYSSNTTNRTDDHIYDANNLQYIDLVADPDKNSYICVNGTGTELCPDTYEREETVFKTVEAGQRLLPKDIGQAYNLPFEAIKEDQIDSDSHAGFTTNNLSWQVNKINLPNMAGTKATTLASSYTVSSRSYSNSVYPIDRNYPTKEVPYTHVETRTVKKVTTEKKLNSVLAIIFGSLAGICFGMAVMALVMCQSKDQSALARNNDMQNGLIQD